MVKHKSGTIQEYKLTDRKKKNTYTSPLFPSQGNDNAIDITSDAEEMKSIINRTRNMRQENPRRPYDHTVQKENCQYGMMLR